MNIQYRAIALGLAGALTLGTAISASAGPLPTGTATVKDAAPGTFTDIRWRGRGIGPGLGFGLAAGALVGAAVAAQPYGYGPGYYYEGGPVYADPNAYGYEPVYQAPVYQAPGYYAPGYSYGGGGCYTDEGNGRRRTCSGQ